MASFRANFILTFNNNDSVRCFSFYFEQSQKKKDYSTAQVTRFFGIRDRVGVRSLDVGWCSETF